MKIVFIAPLPPPITGHSIVSKVLLDELEKNHQTVVVNLSKDSFKEGIDGVKRIIQIFGVLKEVFLNKRRSDVIYITIAESLAGNIKDLLIYIICFGKLKKMFVHLHGGTIKKMLWDKYWVLCKINSFFIKRMGGAIITGISHLSIFDEILPKEKIHIVPNFAQDYLFVQSERIPQKFREKPFRILYMSNLIPKKGYMELAEAFFEMPDELKSRIIIDFAGGFDSDTNKKKFLEKIKEFHQLKYHGIVSGEAKRILFSNAHVFCLPTSYFEGQPISILEAYASGCVVITTAQSGIIDIFDQGINGFVIDPESPNSIKEVISNIIERNEELEIIALKNLKTALEKYRTHRYQNAVKVILESLQHKIN
jgi:glycosyltransferase involved in cell wall biosynthesis